MLTLEQTLLSQSNLHELCSGKWRKSDEIFYGNIFYGMDFILKKYTDLSLEYPLKVVLGGHGPNLSEEYVWVEEITACLPVIQVYPPYRKKAYSKAIEQYGAEKVLTLSAAPFLYLVELLKQYAKPEKKGTIFFPAHSTPLVKTEIEFEILAEELVNLSAEYQPVTVCIYWVDFNLGRHIPFQNRGLRVVSAGHMYDPLFLFRLYHLCSQHQYSGGNAPGSHIFYSIKSGCSYFHLDTVKYSITSDNEERTKLDTAVTPSIREAELNFLFSYPYPFPTAEQMNVVDYYLGADYIGSPQEIREHLLEAEELYKKMNQVPVIIQPPDRRLIIDKSKHQQHSSNFSVSVIVTWADSLELLGVWERNLEYLQNAEIIFIDNGSIIEVREALHFFCKKYDIILLRNQEFFSFAKVRNQGLEIVKGEYVLFLNNNVQVLNSPFKLLYNEVSEGIAGPEVTSFHELGDPYIEGWALWIKKSTLQEIGGWDAEYRSVYWSSIDLCYRVKSAGYCVKGVPAMKMLIRQLVYSSEPESQISQTDLQRQERVFFIKKHYSLHPKIIVDGVVFQLYQNEIASVWHSLLQEWSANGFAKHIVVFDRARTAPKIPGIRYRPAPPYNLDNLLADREILQQLCDEEDADLFISTYYTTPVSTPSVLMVHDMLPEICGLDPGYPDWKGKHHAIQYTSAYIAASDNTAQDIVRFFPNISPQSVTVTHYGVKNTFSLAPPEAVSQFKVKYGIKNPYFLLANVGSGYKNSILFFKAFSQLDNKESFEILCVGSETQLESEFRNYTHNTVVHMLQLTDDELRLAYAGAVALVYPSMYEGFGLPILEAMACGCPIIACPNASIPEVAGDAASYVQYDDTNGLTNALCEVQKPTVRDSLIKLGLDQAKKFSWSKMAGVASSVLINTTLLHLNLREINLIIFPDWSASEESIASDLVPLIRTILTHPNKEHITLLVDNSNISKEEVGFILSSMMMTLIMEEDLAVSAEPELSIMGELSELQWQALLPRVQARILLENENQQAIAQAKAEKIPSYKIESFPVTSS